jgi:subtilisin family serine protease
MTVPHENDSAFDRASSAMTAIARDVLHHPRVIHQADKTCGSLVIALKDELLVRRVPGDMEDHSRLSAQLSQVADQVGALSEEAPGPLPTGEDVEIWKVKSPDQVGGDAISLARRYRTEHVVQVGRHDSVTVPSVSPNHVCVVSAYDTCPGGPPKIPEAKGPPDIDTDPRDSLVHVVVIDTGYVPVHPVLLARGRITAEPGQWFDSAWPGWRDSPPDNFDTYPDDEGRPRLPGVAGHGTFITGIVADRCPPAGITVVGHRHEALPVGTANGIDALRLFTSEIAVARSVLRHHDADVISCGFAFPTLDAYGSIPFTSIMPSLEKTGVALVAPAGNENTTCPHWPAAHPFAFGVAATNDDDGSPRAKADFSNWGSWLKCCSPGEDVISTFGQLEALPQDFSAAPGVPPWDYDFWATWSGTSFSAPKFAGRVASEVAADPTKTAYQRATDLLGPQTVPNGGVNLPYVP